MQKQFIKNIYTQFVYSDPDDHLLKPNNKLTRPQHVCSNVNPNLTKIDPHNVITIQSDITGHYNKPTFTIYGQSIYEQSINTTPEINPQQSKDQSNHEQPKEEREAKTRIVEPKIIYDEETFNQIELRGFITKELLKQSLDRGSNLFHIPQNVFDKLCERYNQFKEILHTLTTEFDNTIECIIETGKELTKKITHIIYELYLAVMHRVQS